MVADGDQRLMVMRAPSRVYPAVRRLASGPWVGVRDAPEPIVSPGGHGEGDGARFLLSAINMYLAPGPDGKGWLGRPGCSPMVDDVETDALGDTGVRTGQALMTWTMENGTRITIAICGGKFYTYNWGANEWTETIDASDLSGKSITLSTTARVALVPFAGKLIVSDGTNTPWMWDGATTVTKLTNAPAFYGPPVVRSGKLVGIKASERNTIVWSEEGDPETGYEAGGYANAWTIGQLTNANILSSLAALEEALLVYRERAATNVVGTINADFQTTHTRVAVDPDHGTKSPWATIVLSQGVLTLDADAKPHVTVGGATMLGLWKDCEDTVKGVIRSSLPDAMAVRDRACNVALIAVGMSSATLDTLLVFSLDTGQFQGIWTGFDMDCIGEVIDDNGNPRWAHFGDGDGIPMLHALPSGSTWNDELPTGTVSISKSVKPRFMFRDLDREIIVDRVTFGIGVDGTSSCTLTYETPRANGTVHSVDLTGGEAQATYGSALYGTATYASAQKERRAEIGTAGQGRWVVPEFRHNTAGETASVTDCRVVGFEVNADPGNP